MTPPEPQEPPQSVLIVDDQYSSIEILAGIVSTLPGAPRVQSFRDSQEALTYAQARQQDLILLDHDMPGMTGLAFLRRIRAFPAYRHVPVVMVTIQADPNLCVEALEAGATDFLNKPVNPSECKARCTNLLAARKDRQEIEIYRQNAEREMQHHREVSQERQTAHIKESMLWTATVIDTYTSKTDGGHIVRVGHYAGLIAQALNIPQADVIDIIAAANTHDIGNVAVPQEILRKATLLTAAERLLMEQHCIEGATLLATLPNDIAQLAAQVARSHHEHIDGSGYPDGLSGDDIPLAARIVAVADVFDALTTPNAIRHAMNIPVAYQHLLSLASGATLHFDIECVDALMEHNDALSQIIPMYATKVKH